MSDEDIQTRAERGAGFARHGLWDDAIREFSAVVEVHRDPGMLMALAEAYAGRFADSGAHADRLSAEELAREVLEVAPEHDGAYQLLAELGKSQPTNTTATDSPPRPIALIVVTFMLCGFGAGVAFKLMMAPEPPPPPVVKEVLRAETPEPTTGERELELEFLENERSDGLSFRTRKSVLSVYPERSYYRIWGDFEVTDGQLVDKIDVKIELLDNDDEVIVADTFDAWASHEPDLRKGDRGAFEHLLRAKPEAERARISVELLESTPDGGEYPDAEVVEPKWAIKQPAHIELEVRERKARASKASFGVDGYFEGGWEFRNLGDHPITALKFTVHVLDARSKRIGTDIDNIVTYNGFPPILAGEAALESVMVQVPDGYDHYELEIVEIE